MGLSGEGVEWVGKIGSFLTRGLLPVIVTYIQSCSSEITLIFTGLQYVQFAELSYKNLTQGLLHVLETAFIGSSVQRPYYLTKLYLGGGTVLSNQTIGD